MALEEAEPIEDGGEHIPAQQAKGISVDSEDECATYFPLSEDWAVGYFEPGGEA